MVQLKGCKMSMVIMKVRRIESLRETMMVT